MRTKTLTYEFLVCSAYALVAIGFTFPLIIQLSNHLPGAGTDPYLCYWSNWWVGWSSFVPGTNIFHCPLVFCPGGAHLNGEPLPFGMVFGLLSKVLPPILSFNLLYLSLFVFAAWGCYRLAIYFWHRRDVAFVAGLIFGFSPYMSLHGTGHFNLINTGFIPLTILAILKVLNHDRFRADKVLLAGILLGLTGLSCNYYLIYLAIWIIGLSIFLAVKGNFHQVFVRLFAIVGVTVVVILPQLWAMIKAFSAGYYRIVSGLGSAYLSSIDLFGILIPFGKHPLWGDWAINAFQSLGCGSVERTAYLGITVLLLGLLGWRYYRDRLWVIWTAIWTIGAWILSLGPLLQVAGRNTFIPLPGIVFTFMPVLKNVRASGRWSIFVILGIALLSAGGLKLLLERGIVGKKINWLWLPVTALILFEFLPTPYPTLTANVPQVVSQLPEDSAHPVILNLPLGRSDGYRTIGEFNTAALLLQTIHHRPIIGGNIGRMKYDDVAVFESGFFAKIIQSQHQASPTANSNQRAEGMKDIIRKWAEKDHPIIKLLEIVAGKQRIQRILSPPPISATTEYPYLPPDSVAAQADHMGIGYIIAIDPSRPQVSAGLEYLENNLNLTMIGCEGKYAFYRVNYPPD